MHSIRFKFYIFLAVIFALFLIAMNTFPVYFARDMAMEGKETSMSGQAAVISAALGTLPRLERDSVAEVMEILDISGYSRVAVCEADGIILYDTAGGAGRRSADRDIYTALESKTVFHSDFTDGEFKSAYSMPVSFRGEITGAVYLYETDTELALNIFNQQKALRNVSVTIMLFAVVISAALFQSLFARIAELVRSMRIVGGGNYSYRHSESGKDEISELGEEFNRLTEQLETNEKQRRRFVADASHELKTPLASIRLLSDSIVQNSGMDSETMREFVTDIDSEANRLQRTTEKLLALSRLDDNISVIPEPVDVKQICYDSISALAPIALEKKVRMRPVLQDGCVIMANHDDIFRVVFNLCENAVKYNVEGGEVTIKLNTLSSDGGDRVQLTVEDTGIGIPEEDKLNVFSRFYRVDKARSREAGGSGLGLSIVHDTVLLYGGTIVVGDNKPCGSIFSVSFPLAKEEETGI